MITSFWMALGISSIGFGLLQSALILRQSRKFKDAQELLSHAKREVNEMAQLPLNNPQPQIQISKSGRVLFANPAALEIFPGIDRQGFSHPVLKEIIEEGEREISFADKTYSQTITTTMVGGEEAYVVYCYDITARKLFEQELERTGKLAKEAAKAAEAAKEARGEFLANMSHELRTPMNGIIGLSDILVEGGLEGEKQDLIEAVNSSARNLLILLNDILDFSKIEAGELTMEHIPFDIRKMVKQIESLQNPIASRKGLFMQSRIEENVPRFLVGDPSRLQQILNNLISNALKFTEEGSVELSVSGREDDQGNFITNIAVKDTGIGIPKEKQAEVFEKFRQADASTTRKYGGTGLGLAITKDLIEIMNGVIAIESEEGKGTIFTVKLTVPIAEDQSAQDERADIQNSRAAINTNAKLMIVDDSPINLLFLRQALGLIGIKNFSEASSGQQALALLSEQHHDLIIMDCQMPEMDGFEATRQIRSRHKEKAPIIIAATANAMKGAEEKCISAGMDDYISKPIDKNKLIEKLKHWIPENAEEDNTEAQDNNVVAINAPLSKTDVIDWKRLSEFTMNDPEVEKNVIEIFIDNLKSDIESLEKSFKEQKYREWNGWVHKLYGSCSQIGASALAEKCDEGQALPFDATTDIERVHAVIINECNRVQNSLEGRGIGAQYKENLT